MAVKVVPCPGPRLVTLTWPPWASVQGFHDGQSNARTAAATISCIVGAIEPLEQVRQVLRRDSLAVVGHGEHDIGTGAGGRQSDVTAGRGVAQRVVEQVAQDLHQPLPVCPQAAAGSPGRQSDVLDGVAVGDHGLDRADELSSVRPTVG